MPKCALMIPPVNPMFAIIMNSIVNVLLLPISPEGLSGTHL
jgi:hypothetical protein